MRIEGWETKLNKYFEQSSQREFVWGKFDCLIFACDFVREVTGIDPMSKKKPKDPETIRGAYTTKDEAKELIKKSYRKSIRKSIRDIMDVHFDRKPVNFAVRGDVVYYKNAFGICCGRGKAFFKKQGLGLEIIKISDCVVAWDI